MAGGREQSVGWVAETETPGIFGAWVQMPRGEPFNGIIGPSRASLTHALGWARSRAEVVMLREGATFYSAGNTRRAKYPEWSGEDRPMPVDPHPEDDGSGAFEVLAGTTWHRPDGEDVTRRLVAGLAERDDVSKVAGEARDERMKVRFVIYAASLELARERGSWLLWETWLGLDIEVREGDIDLSSCSVAPEPSSPRDLFFEDDWDEVNEGSFDESDETALRGWTHYSD